MAGITPLNQGGNRELPDRYRTHIPENVKGKMDREADDEMTVLEQMATADTIIRHIKTFLSVSRSSLDIQAECRALLEIAEKPIISGDVYDFAVDLFAEHPQIVAEIQRIRSQQ